MASRWEDVRARMNLDESSVARHRERMRSMSERKCNPDQYGLGLGPLVLLWLVIAIMCSAGAYVPWFLATHWTTIFPR